MSRLKRQLSRLSGLGTPPGVIPHPPVATMSGTLASPPARADTASSKAPFAALSEPKLPQGLPAGLPGQAAPGSPAAVAGDDEAHRARLDALRSRLATYRSRRRPSPHKPLPATDVLPGQWEETSEGGMHVLRTCYAEDHAHGAAALAHSLRATGAHMAVLALDDTLCAVTSADVLYLDTETTGLAGGAGTLPFLIGMGRFEAGCWQLEQLFLRRPGEEAPMLHHLAARMRQASAIVTYNGKSFDWPLLRTRFVLNRVPLPPVLPHLDLLHCARRLLPQLEGGARLCHVERALLAFERVDDVDGALIPQLYFDFLRGGPVAPMAQVMTHNAHDLAALAAMLGVFAARLDASPVVTISARECLAMARLQERRGDVVQAHAWAVRAASDASDAFLLGPMARLAAGEAHTLRGRLYGRVGDFAAASCAWLLALEYLEGHAILQAEGHLALAKLYEHRLKDIAQALRHAPLTTAAEGTTAMARRVARLQRKSAAAHASDVL